MGLADAVKKATAKVFKEVSEKDVPDFVGDTVKRVKSSKVVKGAKSYVDQSAVIGAPIFKEAYKKDQSSWLLNYNDKIHKPIEFLPGTHHTLKKRYAIPIGMAAGVYGMAKDHGTDVNDARLSDMQSDEMSNMVNISRSPNIENYENRRNPESNTREELKDAKQDTPYGLRTGNAAGDLVFALHELKNGGK